MSKISRNDPCLCGSGKKYKKCCMAKDDAARVEVMVKAQNERTIIIEQADDIYDNAFDHCAHWSTDGEQQLGYMDRVVFTYFEKSDTDIIISFSFAEDTEFGPGGFTIQRAPKFEAMVPSQYHGASVLLDGFEDGVRVTEVYLDRESIKIVTTGHISPFHFYLGRISDQEYRQLIKHFGYINFDSNMKFVC